MSRDFWPWSSHYRSMETARRVADLAAELGIAEVEPCSTKSATTPTASPASFCATHHMNIVGEIHVRRRPRRRRTRWTTAAGLRS